MKKEIKKIKSQIQKEYKGLKVKLAKVDKSKDYRDIDNW